MKMLFTQCKYEMLRIMRNPYYVISSLLSPIIFYLLHQAREYKYAKPRSMAGALSNVDGHL